MAFGFLSLWVYSIRDDGVMCLEQQGGHFVGFGFSCVSLGLDGKETLDR